MSELDDLLELHKTDDRMIPHRELHKIANLARAEIERLHSWDGLMSLVDEHYPSDVVDGSSGEPGPRLIVLLREIERWRVLCYMLWDDTPCEILRSSDGLFDECLSHDRALPWQAVCPHEVASEVLPDDIGSHAAINWQAWMDEVRAVRWR